MSSYNDAFLGWHLDSPDTPVRFAAKLLAHHTAILAQSGSGKSFLLGRILEEIALKTSARVFIIDMNGDFRKFQAVNDDAWEKVEYPKSSGRKERRPRWPGHIAAGEFEEEETFTEVWETMRIRRIEEPERPGCARTRVGPSEAGKALAATFDKWPPAWDVGVLDVPSLGGDRTELIKNSLYQLWDKYVGEWKDVSSDRREEDRVPTFVVIDEAHNVVSDGASDKTSELVTRFAAEGRKYGLFVILATQRPSKMPVGLLQECENVCLLRLQSSIDHDVASQAWGIPKEIVARTSHFKKGEGLLSGRWVPAYSAFMGAYRRTQEGGASLDADHWAHPRDAVARTMADLGREPDESPPGH